MTIRRFLGYIKKRASRVLINSINTVSFLLNSPKKNTVLLVEGNSSHTELFPSFIKYLNTLGFNVEIIVNSDQMGNLPKLNANKIYFFNIAGMKTALNFQKAEKYSFIIFTSYRLYYPTPDKKSLQSTVLDHFNIRQNTACVYHHLEDYNENSKKPAIVLSKNLKKDDGLYVVNPCYFKENTLKNKNKKTIFTTVGKLENTRKNTNLLFDGIRELVKEGVGDFEVNILGDNKKDCIPNDIKEFFNVKGKLSFDKLYLELENADFYLPLLDPLEHQRYLTLGTSGSFQLIRGFLLPPVIHNIFAQLYRFNNENSIIYNENKDFCFTLKKAVNINNEEYLALQKSLLNQRDEIYKISAENLKTLLNKLIGS